MDNGRAGAFLRAASIVMSEAASSRRELHGGRRPAQQACPVARARALVLALESVRAKSTVMSADAPFAGNAAGDSGPAPDLPCKPAQRPALGLRPRRGWTRFWRAYERLATEVLQEDEAAVEEPDLDTVCSSPVTRSQGRFPSWQQPLKAVPMKALRSAA
jgi:hypothetical protein